MSREWKENESLLNDVDEAMERKIRAMKKERNRQRAENQRKNPNAKRRKLDETNKYEEVKKMYGLIEDSESCKIKVEESTQDAPKQKRQKTDIISHFVQKQQFWLN